MSDDEMDDNSENERKMEQTEIFVIRENIEVTKPLKPSSSFQSQSRDEYYKSFRNRSDPAPVGRYVIKYSEVDKYVKAPIFEKMTPRPQEKLKTVEEYPHENIEKCWFSEREWRNHLNNKRKKYTDYNEAIRYYCPIWDKGKPVDPHIINPNGNAEVSTFGYHYWNSKVVPDANTIYWPPLIQRKPDNPSSPIKFKAQTDRIDIKKMTKDVNESRFELVDKNVEFISTQSRNPKYDFGSLVPRIFKKTQVGPNNSFYDYNKEYIMKDLKKNYVDFDRNMGRNSKGREVNMDSVNLEILDKADLKRSQRKRTISFDMNKQVKRDENMYAKGEWYKNCSNEKKNDLQHRLKQSIKIYEEQMKKNKVYEQSNS